MQNIFRRCRRPLLALCAAMLALALLAGCGRADAGAAGSSSGDEPPAAAAPGEPQPGGGSGTAAGEVRTLCRIVDGAEDGSLLLAAQEDTVGDALYRLAAADLAVTLDGEPAGAGQLRDGMLVTVVWNGCSDEIWPALFGEVYALEAESQGIDDRCGLVLQVFGELWAEDDALNEGITYIGVDIDEALVPRRAEREAIAWRFAELHSAQPLTGSWQQLADEGYIDAENLYWEDGVLFALTADNLSINTAEDKGQTAAKLWFTAEKWRSGLGALFYVDCTATRNKDGSWSYEVGGWAIA